MKPKPASSSKQSERFALLKQYKAQAGQNNLLGASIAASKLHRKFKMSPDEIITELDKLNCTVSKPHMYNHFKLADVPAEVMFFLKSGKIKPTEVLGLIKKHQEPAQLIKLVEKAVAKNEKENELKKRQYKEKTETEEIAKLMRQTEKKAQKIGLEKSKIQQIKEIITKVTGLSPKQIQAIA